MLPYLRGSFVLCDVDACPVVTAALRDGRSGRSVARSDSPRYEVRVESRTGRSFPGLLDRPEEGRLPRFPDPGPGGTVCRREVLSDPKNKKS